MSGIRLGTAHTEFVAAECSDDHILYAVAMVWAALTIVEARLSHGFLETQGRVYLCCLEIPAVAPGDLQYRAR